MAQPEHHDSASHRRFNRTYFLVLLVALVVILGLYYFFAFSRQQRVPAGDTPASPSRLVLPASGTDA